MNLESHNHWNLIKKAEKICEEFLWRICPHTPNLDSPSDKKIHLQQMTMEICARGRLGMLILVLFLTIYCGLSYEDLCKDYDCGQGTCKNSSVFPFVSCECQNGWKRPEGPFTIPFLPCVIPNCTLEHSCDGKAPSPAPSLTYHNINNSRLLNPCDWNVCGDGKCETKSNYMYNCLCNEGCGNLMNWTNGYCVRECQIGTDCRKLGISVSGNSTVQIWRSTNSTAKAAGPPSLSALSQSSGGVKLMEDMIQYSIMLVLFIMSMYWT